jgi:hypothetical protein
MQEPPIQEQNVCISTLQNVNILHGRISYMRVSQVSLTVVVRQRNMDSQFILFYYGSMMATACHVVNYFENPFNTWVFHFG